MECRSCRDGRGECVSIATGVVFPERGLTQQQFRDEVDVNNIIRRFGVSGVLPLAREPAEYGDFSGATDFHSAMNAVVAARQAFNGLPASIRSRFENDPGLLWEALQDPAREDELVKLGVLKPAEKPAVEPAVKPAE